MPASRKTLKARKITSSKTDWHLRQEKFPLHRGYFQDGCQHESGWKLHWWLSISIHFTWMVNIVQTILVSKYPVMFLASTVEVIFQFMLKLSSSADYRVLWLWRDWSSVHNRRLLRIDAVSYKCKYHNIFRAAYN